MREIKFRFWWPARKILAYKNLNDLINGLHTCKEVSSQGLVACSLDWIISQFTGLTDKNDKDIYEGDIITENRSFNDDDPNSYLTHEQVIKYQVYWDSGHHGFVMLSLDKKYNSVTSLPQVNGYNLEIIGNIYENPEFNRI